MEELTDLLNVSASLEDVSGYKISSLPFELSPPLAPTASPKPSPPPAPLDTPSPSPRSSPSPPARTTHNWSAAEVERVLKYFYIHGPKFRRISRYMAGRSEDAVRQLLKRRGVIAPQSSPVRRRQSSKAPRWSESEDRRLLDAFETVPRHKRGSVQWRRVKAAAGLNRLPHALRNRLRRLEAMTR